MTTSPVRVERDGRVATVRFNRGDKANAMSLGLLRELLAAFRTFEDDAETSAITLVGGAQNFTLGYDLDDASAAPPEDRRLAVRRLEQSVGSRLCRAVAEAEPLVIAALEGWCVGGGVSLAVACDLRVMAADARFYVPEIERGMNMASGTVPRAVALVGPARAHRLITLAERTDAQTAADWGLADAVVPAGEARARAREFAERAATLPPVQVRMIKQQIHAAAQALGGALSALDRDQFLLAQASDDFAEGVAAFRERRPAKYTGS